MNKNKKGFSILELLVVIVIIGIVSVALTPRFVGIIEKSEHSQDLAEINSVGKAAHLYYIENSEYPTLQGGQPIYGNPHNIDFSKIYPGYLVSLPHFSYWYIDYRGIRLS